MSNKSHSVKRNVNGGAGEPCPPALGGRKPPAKPPHVGHSESSRSRDGAAWLAPVALWFVGFALAFYPTLVSGFQQLQILPGDPRLVNYLFEHSYRWLTGWPLHGSLWSPPVFYPAEGVGAYTDTVLGAAPFYWVWRSAGFAPDLSYQLWMMVCLTLNFATAYVFLLRAVCLAPWPSAVGALLFGFGSVRLANFNSGQLFVVFYGMAALFTLVRVFEAAQKGEAGGLVARWLHVFAALLVLQIWSSWYPSFFLLLALVAAALAALCFSDTRRALLDLARRHPLAIASAGLLGIAAIAPMLLAHLGAVAEVGWRDEGMIARGLPTWTSWIYMGQDHWLYGGLSRFDLFLFRTGSSQHSNGVGFVTAAVAVLGLLGGRRRPLVRIVLVATVLLVVGSTRLFGDFSLWPGVQAVVPGADAIRFVARIGMLLLIPASIGVAIFLDDRRRRATGWLAAIVAGACIVEQGHILVYEDTEAYNQKVAVLASEVGPDCEAFFLSVEHPVEAAPGAERRFKLAQVAAMWVALEAGIPTVNGILGNAPPGYPLSKAIVQGPEGRQDIEARLLAWSTRSGIEPGAVCHLHVPVARMPAAAHRTGDAGPS